MFHKLFIFLFSSLCFASPDIQLSLRHHLETNQNNQIDISGYGRTPFFDWLELSAGGRVYASDKDFEALEGALEGKTYPFSFLSLSLRYQEHFIFPETLSLSHLLFTTELKLSFGNNFNFYIQGGWYKRFTHLNKAVLLPTFRSSYTEHDFTAGLGFYFLSESWKADLRVATFEEISIFNLNNPFIEMRISKKYPDYWIFLLGRYQVLLGFGRMDEWISSAGISFNL